MSLSSIAGRQDGLIDRWDHPTAYPLSCDNRTVREPTHLQLDIQPQPKVAWPFQLPRPQAIGLV